MLSICSHARLPRAERISPPRVSTKDFPSLASLINPFPLSSRPGKSPVAIHRPTLKYIVQRNHRRPAFRFLAPLRAPTGKSLGPWATSGQRLEGCRCQKSNADTCRSRGFLYRSSGPPTMARQRRHQTCRNPCSFLAACPFSPRRAHCSPAPSSSLLCMPVISCQSVTSSPSPTHAQALRWRRPGFLVARGLPAVVLSPIRRLSPWLALALRTGPRLGSRTGAWLAL